MAECFVCKRQFICGVLSRSASTCWCQALPALMPVPLMLATTPTISSNVAQPGCCCPECLQILLLL
ncbi:cysteine-rich CWC family protein [Glaciimonas sp. GNP009]